MPRFMLHWTAALSAAFKGRPTRVKPELRAGLHRQENRNQPTR
jgi:hypothetical protein